MDAIQRYLEDIVTLAETIDGFTEATVTVEIKLHGGSETKSIRLVSDTEKPTIPSLLLSSSLQAHPAKEWFF